MVETWTCHTDTRPTHKVASSIREQRHGYHTRTVKRIVKTLWALASAPWKEVSVPSGCEQTRGRAPRPVPHPHLTRFLSKCHSRETKQNASQSPSRRLTAVNRGASQSPSRRLTAVNRGARRIGDVRLCQDMSIAQQVHVESSNLVADSDRLTR